MMRERKEKVCYCCPACGRYQGKVAASDSESELICGKCGAPYVLIVSQNKATTFIDKRNTNRRAFVCAH